jgi:hypothetical protein
MYRYACSWIHPPYECDCLWIPPQYCFVIVCMISYVYVIWWMYDESLYKGWKRNKRQQSQLSILYTIHNKSLNERLPS